MRGRKEIEGAEIKRVRTKEKNKEKEAERRKTHPNEYVEVFMINIFSFTQNKFILHLNSTVSHHLHLFRGRRQI